jgi:hypothetical protein
MGRTDDHLFDSSLRLLLFINSTCLCIIQVRLVNGHITFQTWVAINLINKDDNLLAGFTLLIWVIINIVSDLIAVAGKVTRLLAFNAFVCLVLWTLSIIFFYRSGVLTRFSIKPAIIFSNSAFIFPILF